MKAVLAAVCASIAAADMMAYDGFSQASFATSQQVYSKFITPFSDRGRMLLATSATNYNMNDDETSVQNLGDFTP